MRRLAASMTIERDAGISRLIEPPLVLKYVLNE